MPEDIGHVKSIQGSAFVIRTDGTRVALEQGTAIYSGDTVETEAGSKLGIVFIDKTTFTMSEDASMVLNELIYNPAGDGNSSITTLIKGAFIIISGEVGKLAPEAVIINTPASTIGIRGTGMAFDINLNGTESVYTLLFGAIMLTNAVAQVLLSEPLSAVSFSSFNLPPSPVFTMSQDQFNDLFNAIKNISDQINSTDTTANPSISDGVLVVNYTPQDLADFFEQLPADQIFDILETLITMQIGTGRHDPVVMPEPILIVPVDLNPEPDPIPPVNDGDGDEGSIVIIGTPQDDILEGNDNNNLILGLNSDDIIFGGTGNDLIFGNNGKDILRGEEGDDILVGGNGKDILYGGEGKDILYGGQGNDTFIWESPDEGFFHSTDTMRGPNEFGDILADFDNNDTLQFDAEEFGFDGPMTLAEGQEFYTIDETYDGTNSGQTANDPYFVYSSIDDTLYYDADPSTEGYTIIVTVAPGGDDITASDVEIVST